MFTCKADGTCSLNDIILRILHLNTRAQSADGYTNPQRLFRALLAAKKGKVVLVRSHTFEHALCRVSWQPNRSACYVCASDTGPTEPHNL